LLLGEQHCGFFSMCLSYCRHNSADTVSPQTSKSFS
jgi:hypothetical protein